MARRRVAEYPDDPQSWSWLGFFEDNVSGAEGDSTRAAERLSRVRSFDRDLTAAPSPDPSVRRSGPLRIPRST